MNAAWQLLTGLPLISQLLIEMDTIASTGVPVSRFKRYIDSIVMYMWTRDVHGKVFAFLTDPKIKYWNNWPTCFSPSSTVWYYSSVRLLIQEFGIHSHFQTGTFTLMKCLIVCRVLDLNIYIFFYPYCAPRATAVVSHHYGVLVICREPSLGPVTVGSSLHSRLFLYDSLKKHPIKN